MEEDATVGVMILHGNVPEMEHPPPISDVEWGRTQFATGADPAPFLSYVDIRREADGALMRGEYGTASVLAATASEVFLETLILHLLWSEGKTPAEAAALVMDRGLATRVRTDYHGRLGGQWSCAGKGSVAAWSEKTAKLRHRVVHAGYRPTRAESIQSLEAMHGLDKFVADKLCSPSKLKLYPATALALAGEAGLRRRKKSEALIEDLLYHARDWLAEFVGWNASVTTLRMTRVDED